MIQTLRYIGVACVLQACAAGAIGQSLTIGLLNSVEGHCGDIAGGENQRYWYPRVPPYVGFGKGERTTAGGDGTCYIGFPDTEKLKALIRIDGHIVELRPTRYRANATSRFQSENGKTVVVIRVRGASSTCSPNDDKCCGGYTYADITVQQGKSSATVKAARYVGG